MGTVRRSAEHEPRGRAALPAKASARREAARRTEGAIRGALPAKVSAPRLTNTIARERVSRILERALVRGAVSITGPAGAGKTTAVADYLTARSRPAVWYDVDATDSDVANVFLYLARAARAATRARRQLPQFRVQHLGSLRLFAGKFLEALFAGLPRRAILVLDNCQAIAGNPAWAEILEQAVLAPRFGQGLVLVSRADPPAELSRHLVNQRLVHLSGKDLRFSEREAGTLARTRVPARVRRHKQALETLCALADGWAAGLVLVLDHAARGETTAELARHDARLFEYFSAEILSQLSPDAQHVLLATALLPCMTERMAAAVAESDRAGAVLADLHRRGLLIERLPTSETTYRYHPLLRAFLLARADPSPEALARAAAACAAGGLLDDAVDLYARAGAENEAATLVLAHAPRLLGEGRYKTLSAWIERLSEPTLASQPWLRYWQATANIASDQAGSARQFERAYAEFEARDDAAGLYLTIAGAIQLVTVESEDFRRLDPWFDRLGRVLAGGPAASSPDIDAAAMTSAIMAAVVARVGHPQVARWADRALTLAPADLGVRVRLWASLLAWLSHADRLDQAAALLVRLRSAITPALDPLTRVMVNEAHIYRAVRSNWRKSLEIIESGLAIVRAEGLQLFEATYLAACAQSHAPPATSRRQPVACVRRKWPAPRCPGRTCSVQACWT